MCYPTRPSSENATLSTTPNETMNTQTQTRTIKKTVTFSDHLYIRVFEDDGYDRSSIVVNQNIDWIDFYRWLCEMRMENEKEIKRNLDTQTLMELNSSDLRRSCIDSLCCFTQKRKGLITSQLPPGLFPPGLAPTGLSPRGLAPRPFIQRRLRPQPPMQTEVSRLLTSYPSFFHGTFSENSEVSGSLSEFCLHGTF